MKKLFTREYIEEGGLISTGYGVAYTDWRINCKVCYPIPFHWIVRWSRDLYFWAMIAGWPGYKEKWEREVHTKFASFIHEASITGYERGYREAIERCRKYGIPK